ncbi:hypothetical protein AYO40_04095 [Planctomycetaceae bacterium SCGC AG-212-D15]|nr:hypothetical protein AYO40_04095 [Planctomycetaceae bacterium SCGC AG-212-D15]
MSKTILETPRLLLRELSLGDLDFIAALLADPEVMRFYPKCLSRDESEVWLRRQFERYERDGFGMWLVVEKATGQPVGRVGLTRQEVEGVTETEIGYMIQRERWRRGFASEAAAGCRDHAFGVLGKERVISLIRPANAPSQAVARKIGMTPGPCIVQHAELEHLVFAMGRPV